ncbi:hypothetical protein NQ315_016050 [Exocentrus adspersus]|uniref:MIF4G domain-containing protein n=1 Tax=Exocentrus adspersus TaxID=1586481 RepID=A0AAV8VKS9_9CUCU|nr:hypothetical protein NQ315_016050 [Exocentrus adspersus]
MDCSLHRAKVALSHRVDSGKSEVFIYVSRKKSLFLTVEVSIILNTVNHNRGKNLMNQYFERMKMFAENQDLQPRIRFMLKDIIDLRQDGWVPRKATVVEGPMPINQIKPVDDDRTGYRKDRNHDRENERSSNMSELFRHPMKTRGGLDDMLMGITLTQTTHNLIPTSPFGNHNGFGNQRDVTFRGHNQRSGYNNYTNQRGQYKHSQNSSNSQFNQCSKEVAPRFKKNSLIVAKDEIADVELRPNSMLFNKASVKANNMMNTRTLESSFTPTSIKQSPSTLLKEPLPIKQMHIEKPKQSKKDKIAFEMSKVREISNIINPPCIFQIHGIRIYLYILLTL